MVLDAEGEHGYKRIETYSDQFIVVHSGFSSQRDRVLEMIRKAGFDPKVADKVVQCESQWQPLAIGDNGESLGLWQIHQPAHPIGEACAFDPVCSTNYAIKLINSRRGFTHWTCYSMFYGPNVPKL